jgi:hypothetical protein
MDNETLYWILSTLPQVSAALVAFIGFLALQSLEEPSGRRTEFEAKTRRFCDDYFAQREWADLVEKNLFTIQVMSRDELSMFIDSILLKALFSETWKSRTDTLHLHGYRNEWKRIDQQINRTQKRLTVFVSFHLVVIVVTLSLIPFIESLKSFPWIKEALVATAVVMGGTVGCMIRSALYRH